MKILFFFFLIFILFGCLNRGDGMKIKSVFENNEKIPEKYTCQGQDINPPLFFEDIPENTVSLVMIMDDPDAPMGTWDHWILFNMPVIGKINENSTPENTKIGKNSWEKTEYGGPCPPYGTHRYFFKLYALDTNLNLENGASKKQIEEAMQGHVIARAELIGLYEKH